MDRVDAIYTDPDKCNNIHVWDELLNESRLDDSEIREILLYRTFYYFVEKLSTTPGLEESIPVSNDVVRLFADKFEWINEEVSLVRHFGTAQIDLVFRHAYGGQAEPPPPVNHVDGYGRGQRISLLLWLLIFFSLLIFLVVYTLGNYPRNIINPDVPYYSCKILFSKSAKQKDYSSCKAMAAAGDDKAQLLWGLAQLYSGRGNKDPKAAIDWLTRSANQSNNRTMFMLGAIQGGNLDIDNGGAKYTDFDSAAYWLDRAANTGEKYASTYLASLYVIRGNDLDDLRLAREKLIVAANSEQPDAYFAMALFELYGLVAKADYQTARKWLDLYARNSVPEGSNQAAWLLATSVDQRFRDAAQAAQYTALLTRDPRDPNLFMYLDTVAAVDAANGKFDAAVEIQQQAINVLKRQDKDVYKENIAGFQKRLMLYRKHGTWTERLPDNFVQLSFEGIKNRIFIRELTDIVRNTH